MCRHSHRKLLYALISVPKELVLWCDMRHDLVIVSECLDCPMKEVSNELQNAV